MKKAIIKKAKDLEAGDIIIDPNGQHRKVLRVNNYPRLSENFGQTLLLLEVMDCGAKIHGMYKNDELINIERKE